MTRPGQRMAIVGAGPIGLEAALFAVRAGFDVRIFEHRRVAENVRQWGHVRLFSPFGMNASPWGREALAAARPDLELPSADALLTGHEFVRNYLEPLSRLPILADCIVENTPIRSITRNGLAKGEWIGRPERSRTPFRLLTEVSGDGEHDELADVVLDCSGTYGYSRWVGIGGAPCIGEIDCLHSPQVRLPDVLGKDRERFAGRKVLVIGSGYSAATTVIALADLARQVSGTSVTWITRDRALPIPRIPEDVLLERDRLAETANRIATSDDGPVRWQPGSLVRRIRRSGAGGFVVTLEHLGQTHELSCDEVIALVGYRPDRELYEELQVHECYASQGPMKLAAALLGESSPDCLAQSAPAADSLRNPEPNFFILGAKSYGRDSRFLLKIGHDQIRSVFALLERGDE